MILIARSFLKGLKRNTKRTYSITQFLMLKNLVSKHFCKNRKVKSVKRLIQDINSRAVQHLPSRRKIIIIFFIPNSYENILTFFHMDKAKG
jgi:argonaute-like protein implicated in RNA metabolism and viral defense